MKNDDNSLFLSLTKDRIFKIFFKGREDLVKSLLESFLPLPKGSVIEGVSILDPELHQDKIHKLFVLDLCVKIRRMLNGILARPEKVNVEVQTTSYKHFTDRVLAYSSRLYGNQLREGEGFDQLLPIYTLVFTTVNLREFKDVQDYCHICNLRRTEYPYAVMSKGMCFVIVELDKFRSELNHLLDTRDAWCYLLKNASNMNEKDYFYFKKQQGGIMAKAADHLWDLSQDEILQEIAFKERLNEMERQAIEKERQEAEKEAREKAVKQAVEQGIKQGIKQGIEQGIEQKQKEFVLKLIERKMKLQEICEITGLSEAEVQKMSK